MDKYSKQVTNAFEIIATVNDMFIALSQRLRNSKHISDVINSIEFRKYISGAKIEIYADARLKNDKAFCCWLEINWDEEKWSIERVVLVNIGQEQNILREFPDKTSETLDSFLVELKESASELIESFEAIDFEHDRYLL